MSYWLMQILLFTGLQIQFKLLLAEYESRISPTFPLFFDRVSLISVKEKPNINKRDAGCIFEPEITPEGSDQFGIRLIPLRGKSPSSSLQTAASTYQATQYQPVQYNLPPVPSNDLDVKYVNHQPSQKTTQNPFSISKYKATTPKYLLTSPEPADEAEPAGSGDVFESVKPSTVGPEYLPPYEGEQTRSALTKVSLPSAPSNQQAVPLPVGNFNLMNKAPFQQFSQQPSQIGSFKPEQSPIQPIQNINNFHLNEEASDKNDVQQYQRPESPSISQQIAFRDFKSLPSTNARIREENLKNYLPPENAAPSEENLNFARLETTKATTSERSITNEYLPPDRSSDSTNDNPTFLQPVSLKKPANGLANQFTTPDEHYHTLEELCNDPFHSFLCVQLKPRSKDRFKNRNSMKSELKNLQYSSKTQPSGVSQKPLIPVTFKPTETDTFLAPAASFENIAQVKVEKSESPQNSEEKRVVQPASSTNQLSIIPSPETAYLPPSLSTFSPTTVAPKKAPSGLYATDPFSELIFVNPAKPSPRVKPTTINPYNVPQIEDKNILPEPSNNQFQFAPRQFPSTVKPMINTEKNCQENDHKLLGSPTTVAVSEKQQGYIYPQPSASFTFLTGYQNSQPEQSSVVSSAYNPSQPDKYLSNVPQASNRHTSATSYPISVFNEKIQQPITSHESLQPTVPTTQKFNSTTKSKPYNLLYPKDDSFLQSTRFQPPKKFDASPLLNPNDFNFLPSELSEINKFQGDASGKVNLIPTASNLNTMDFSGLRISSAIKNNTPLIPAADTSLLYSVPQPVSPVDVKTFDNSNGYFYPNPSNNVPVFETTSKPKPATGYDYSAPSIDKRLRLPSRLSFQNI